MILGFDGVKQLSKKECLMGIAGRGIAEACYIPRSTKWITHEPSKDQVALIRWRPIVFLLYAINSTLE